MHSANNSQIPSNSEGLAARQCACELLLAVFDRRTNLEHAMEALPRLRSMSHADKAFCLRLVRLVCNRYGELDALLDQWISTPLPDRANVEIRQILRLGLAQLLFADIPAHAAVHSSVELAKHSRFKGFAGLVNAVLKRAVREAESTLKPLDGFSLNLPDWFRRTLENAYGPTKARAIYEAQLVEAPIDLTLRQPATAEGLPGQLLPTGSLRLEHAQGLEQMPGYAQGAWWVQDAAAALPAQMLGISSGDAVLDLCAAPGGKTLQLAAMGAKITALDRSGPRNARLKKNMARMEFDGECITADATQWQSPHSWKFILLDAPCSATGTLRRHPDVVLTRGPADIAKLAALQSALLNRAFEWLEPGGILVYAVCSLMPEEGPQQIQALLARQSNAKLAPLPEGLALPTELMASDAELRTLPSCWADIGGMDGFYAARIQKEKVS